MQIVKINKSGKIWIVSQEPKPHRVTKAVVKIDWLIECLKISFSPEIVLIRKRKALWKCVSNERKSNFSNKINQKHPLYTFKENRRYIRWKCGKSGAYKAQDFSLILTRRTESRKIIIYFDGGGWFHRR
jgi:hypothetical protein